MSDPSDFPEITFKCPKVWAEMPGDERTRFCDVCNRQVNNLSLMNKPERRALLTAEGQSPCVAYFKHLNGAAIDATALSEANPLRRILTQAAALSISTMSLLPSCTTNAPPPDVPAKNPSGTVIPEMGVGSIISVPSDLWRREMLQRTVQGG